VTGDLQPRSADLGIPGVTIDGLGLRVDAVIAYDEWERIGLHLGVIRDLTSWSLGDWILIGETMFDEDRVAQGVEITGRKKATLLEYARISRKVPRSRRRTSLSWTCHQIVAALEPEEQTEWLDRAEANRWSPEELRGVVRESAYRDRANESRSPVRVLELVERVARDLLRASEPLGDGFARVPMDIVERLANALGPEAP
jgi:hypothetical protein